MSGAVIGFQAERSGTESMRLRERVQPPSRGRAIGERAPGRQGRLTRGQGVPAETPLAKRFEDRFGAFGRECHETCAGVPAQRDVV
jgi:hypothetical protein